LRNRYFYSDIVFISTQWCIWIPEKVEDEGIQPRTEVEVDITRPTEGEVEGIRHQIGVDMVEINLIQIIISKMHLAGEGVDIGVDEGGGGEVGEGDILLGIGLMCFHRMLNLYLT
jgi:hypothetical protein